MTSQFRRISEQQEGQWVSLRVIECIRCAFVGRVRDSSRSGLPAEVCERKFRQLGWEHPTPAGGICPKCATASKATQQHPAEKDQPMAAEPPKEPTINDRRRIREALDAHYIEERGCYRQAFSDKSLAAKLNVPAKWVADLREANGYGPDANEEASAAAAEVKELRKLLTQFQDDFMKRADEIEQRIKRLEVKASYAA